MNLEKPIDLEMWWPSPEALQDLQVEDWEEGFHLSAPDGTACAEWLNFWTQSKEHEQIFNQAFEEMLRIYLDTLENQHGENEELLDGQDDHRVEA